MKATVIKVNDIYKSYRQLKAVNGLSFEVKEATCFGFLGPNGAGKTTLLKMLYGKSIRDKHPSSSVNIFGYDPLNNELQIKHLSGVIPQENSLDTCLNVKQNLMLYSKFYGIPLKQAEKRIDYLLDFMELTDKKTSKIKELSGGMKRRLVISRALLNNPKLLILDEPTTGLDPQVRHLIWDKLRQLKKSGTTILLTTHYMEEAFYLADNILIINKGEKIIEGNPKILLAENMEKYVLEIFDKKTLSSISPIEGYSQIRKDESHETPLLYSNDLRNIKNISEKLNPGDCYLRQTNLEDLFLKLTGRKLHEQQ